MLLNAHHVVLVLGTIAWGRPIRCVKIARKVVTTQKWAHHLVLHVKHALRDVTAEQQGLQIPPRVVSVLLVYFLAPWQQVLQKLVKIVAQEDIIVKKVVSHRQTVLSVKLGTVHPHQVLILFRIVALALLENMPVTLVQLLVQGA